jgi:tripartite-type tricarboxylate transporter receptor subunit TctC
MFCTFRKILCLFMLACAFAGAHGAPVYPDRPVRLLVPFPPGGATDTVIRLVAQRLSVKWSQQVIVDNRPGAGTIIATDLAAKAAPDGYTLVVVTAAFAVNPSLYSKVPYDSEKDLTPVTLLSSAPNVLVVNASVPVSSVKELVAYARAHPGKINFASAGNGTSNHLAGEMFKSMAGIDIVHVPYKGDAPSITDLIGGQVQMLFIGLAPVADQIKAGRLKALGVSSSKPSPLVPGLPTVASAVPGFESAVWNGIMAPAHTPPAIVNQLQADIAGVLADPEIRKKILAMGFEPVGNSPAQFGDYLRRESKRSAQVVKDAHIKIE